jgi:hypothetical protein
VRTAWTASPCIDVRRSEETRAEIDRDAAVGEFTVARSDLVARGRRTRARTRTG